MTTYKLNFNEIKTKAHGQWLNILEQCGLSVKSKSTHSTCPICSKEGTFRVDDKDIQRTYICSCSSGDGIKLLTLALNISSYEAFKKVNEAMEGKTFNEAHSVNPARSNAIYNNKDANRKRQQAVDNALKYSSRTPTIEALDYYDARCIICSEKKHDFVQYGMQIYKGIKGFIHPVIMPILSRYKGKAVGLVRIYLDHGQIYNKLGYEIDIAKKPFLRGGVETLAGYGTWFTKGNINTLHVVEGFENGLSIATALKTTRIVCGHTASLLGNLIIPDCVKILHIWGDHGKTGEKAVNKLMGRYGSTISIIKHFPRDRDQDWNDSLICDGGREIKEALLKEVIF